MSLVIWRGGALFENFMNHYMNFSFPKGVDPSRISLLLGNASLVSGLEMTNTTSLVTGLAVGDGASEEDVVIA